MRKWVFLSLLLFVWLSHAQQSQDIQIVLRQLQSQDNAARLEAVERAPSFGAAILPHLPALLVHQDWRVQRAAQIVLERIATQTPKVDAKERKEVIGALLALTRPEQPVSVRKAALSALGICGDDEIVPHLALLLEDKQVRGDALAALRRINSSPAARAVADAAASAEGDWLRALLATLGEMGRPEGVSVLLKALKTGDIQTKSVAVKALGRIGDARAIPALLTAVQQKVPSAFDALILTGELLLQRKQVSSATYIFSQALKLAKTEHEKCAALLGLGKTGSAKALPILVDALDAGEISVRNAAVEALISYRHPNASRGFSEMFRRANPTEKAQLLNVLVARREPFTAKLLQESSKSPNSELRRTALELMGEIDDPNLERVLWETVLKGDNEVRTVALRSYLRLAENRARGGRIELARSMFEQGLRTAEKSGLTEFVNLALRGIALLGDPKSLPIVQGYLKRPEPPREAFAAAIAIANSLAKGGNKAEAVGLLKSLLSLKMPRELGIQTAQVLAQLGEDPSALPRQSGFIVRWWLLGPLPNPNNRAFERAFIDETGIPNLDEPVRVDRRQIRWREVRTIDPQGIVDLTRIFGQTENVACYAYAELVVESEMEAELRLGSDDSIKVWLNGRLVHQFGGMRGLSVDQDRIRVKLEKGVNRLLLKVTQGGGGWEFCVRLVDLQGKPVSYQEP